MEKEKLQKICKIVHRITLLIGLLTIVVPLAFWSKIPNEIPIHYEAFGVVDNYADKSSLILLFFAVAMLMGVMNIAIYYVKSSAASKYANEAEKSQSHTVYPMIVFMNLSIQVMFAYIMACCVMGRNLGVWFAPVFLTITFLPVIFLVIKQGKGKRQVEKNLEKSTDKGDGIIYRSKVDWWLGLILVGSVGGMIWDALEPIVKGRGVDWTITIGMAITLLIILPLFSIKYVLHEDHLFVSCGFYMKARIPYNTICGMKETRNPLSSMAMSLDRIQIDYVENGVHRMILISPMRKKEFMEKVEGYMSKE